MEEKQKRIVQLQKYEFGGVKIILVRDKKRMNYGSSSGMGKVKREVIGDLGGKFDRYL